MRLILAGLLALLLGVAAHAADGFRAVFAGQQGEGDLVIEVAANGDFRVGPETGDQYGIGIGEDFFLVSRGQDGAVQVLRIADVAAELEAVLPPEFRALFAEVAAGADDIRMTRTGTRTIAGFRGEVWRISLGKPPEVREVVLSQDPRLRPAGDAMGRFIRATMLMMAPLIGPEAGGMIREARTIFAKGTPIGGDGGFLLKSAGPAAVSAERVALPVAPLDRDAIRRSLAPPSR